MIAVTNVVSVWSKSGGLYEVSTGQDRGKEACFGCLPTSDVQRYDGWAQRMATKQHRAEVARKNFGHQEATQ